MHKNASNILTRTLDLDTLLLTNEQKTHLEAIARMPASDAPNLPDAVWTTSLKFPLKNKRQISLRINADVLDWFKTTGSRYQTRINVMLRSYVEAQETGGSHHFGASS